MADKAVILVCFDFPPNAGIGGRRWAKLSKALLTEGYTVHVIKAEPLQGEADSAWSDDVAHPNLKVYELPRTFPEVVDRGPKNLIEKFTYRLALRKLQRIEKGTIYDRAIGWRKPFEKQLLAVLNTSRAKNVIVTGAPFNLMYYAAEILEQHPEVQLIVDYRDPWLTAENYGMADLSEERRAVELHKQKRVFDVARYVLSPADKLTETIATFASSEHTTQFRTLRHFYDPDDLDTHEPSADTSGIKLVYGGALYLGLEPYLEQLAEGIRMLKTHHPQLFESLELHFYTPHHRFANIFDGLSPQVQFHRPIGKQFFDELKGARAAMIFLAEHNKDFLTTKFFELVPFKKPLLFFGAQGQASAAIEADGLGKVHTSVNDFVQSIQALAADQLRVNDALDLDDYSLRKRGEELIALLQP